MRRETKAILGEVLARLLPQLDERQRRLALGAAARVVGYGGVCLGGGGGGGGGGAGGAGAPGAERLRDRDPGLVAALRALVEPDQRGDPQSPLRWTTKSTRNLAA